MSKFFKNLFGRQISHGSENENPQELAQALDDLTIQRQFSYDDYEGNDDLQQNVVQLGPQVSPNLGVGPPGPGVGEMKAAYDLGNVLVRERLANEDPENAQLLADVKDTDIIVVSGTYDHIHLVLEAVKMPFKSVDRSQVAKLDLRPDQTVYVNCPNSFPADGAKRLAKFVAEGGQLITTDWALKYVIEVAFPKTVAYNGCATGDDVVSVEIVDKEDDVLKGFLDQKGDAKPQWWLECSSYPIKVLDKDKVKVLVRSEELAKRYKDDPVIISFEWGKGIVYHMISHFYLQRSETRSQKHLGSVMDYGNEQNLSTDAMEYYSKVQLTTPALNYAMVQSASTSAEFVSRSVLKHKKRTKGLF